MDNRNILIQPVLLNRRHEAELRLPVLEMRALFKKMLGSLTGNVISNVSNNPVEAFRSHICGYGIDRPEGYEVCPLYASGVCKGPNNNGVAKIAISKFDLDSAHCVDGLDASSLMSIQDDVYRSNLRRRGE